MVSVLVRLSLPTAASFTVGDVVYATWSTGTNQQLKAPSTRVDSEGARPRALLQPGARFVPARCILAVIYGSRHDSGPLDERDDAAFRWGDPNRWCSLLFFVGVMMPVSPRVFGTDDPWLKLRDIDEGARWTWQMPCSPQEVSQR